MIKFQINFKEGSTIKKQAYKWQPEIYSRLIYWSCTLISLLLGLVITFEHSGVNWFGIGCLVLFLILIFLDRKRKFFFHEDYLYISCVLPSHNKKIPIDRIVKITEGPNSIVINIRDEKAGQVFMMRNKLKKAFIQEIARQNSAIEIDYDKNLSITKE